MDITTWARRETRLHTADDGTAFIVKLKNFINDIITLLDGDCCADGIRLFSNEFEV